MHFPKIYFGYSSQQWPNTFPISIEVGPLIRKPTVPEAEFRDDFHAQV
jgi:hypothetical protein